MCDEIFAKVFVGKEIFCNFVAKDGKDGCYD